MIHIIVRLKIKGVCKLLFRL